MGRQEEIVQAFHQRRLLHIGLRRFIPQFDQVGAGHDAKDLALLINHRDLAPMAFNHGFAQSGNRVVWSDRYLARLHKTVHRFVAQAVVEGAVGLAPG